METIDIIIILTYLAICFGVAIWVGRKSTLDTFLVAGRKFHTTLLVFTTLSTMVGLSTVIAASSATYSSGISYTVMAASLIMIGYVLVWFFAKKIKVFGDKYKAHTMGDFLAVRYSNRARVIGSIAIIISYFTFFAGLLLGLSQIFQVFGGQGLFWSLIFALGGVLAYTTLSGVKSDFYTDIIHFIVMIIALVIVMIPLMLIKSNGIINLFIDLPTGFTNIYNFGGAGLFWFAIIFGFPTFLLYMEIWQRIYASNNAKTARKIIVWSALLTIPFIAIALIVGLVARKFLPGINPDYSFLLVIKEFLPTGILGLAIAGLIATILSTLNTMIMVISAILTKDFYMTFVNKKSSEKKYLKIGRVITLCVGAVGILIAYIYPNLVELAVAANEGLIVLAPAIIGGFLWKRASERGAFYSMLFGLIILWGSYPFLGKMSFIPAVIISLIIFIILSLKKK
jgi:SSS family solute:Na+ symporter